MSDRGEIVRVGDLHGPRGDEHHRGGWSLAGAVCRLVAGHRFVDLADEAWNEIDPWAAVRRYSARVAICSRCGCERLRHHRGSGAEIWHPLDYFAASRPAVPDVEIVALGGDW